MKDKIYLPKSYEELIALSIEELTPLWKRYFNISVKKLKSAMYRPLWYKIQCDNMNLKLDSKHITKLNRYSSDPNKYVENSYKIKYHIKLGSHIIKTYKGKTYNVIVKDKNIFEYNGEIYKTLSAVAKVICHKKVSGYDFFGLNNKGVNKDVQN
ncbi:MAG: DUF2924 domain-containing protein [Alphaproteobacteria bacterium]|nr:DUF2924 domain-containing protein [Alphaproteobacteria bacterium]